MHNTRYKQNSELEIAKVSKSFGQKFQFTAPKLHSQISQSLKNITTILKKM